MRNLRAVFFFVVCVVAVYGTLRVFGNPLTKPTDWPVLSAISGASYASELKTLAARYDKAPVNAHVVKYWGLIPALNGVKLDIKKSLSHQNLQNKSASPLFFEQIAPAVSTFSLVAEPIYRANPQKRQMALMINVAWGGEYLPSMLKILMAHHAKATFFFDGSFAKKNPQAVKMVLQAGMEVGNHAYNHPMMTKLSRVKMIEQITRTNAVIERAGGVKPALFAPPAGDVNALVVRAAAGLGMHTILWTLDTIDWRKPSVSVILHRIVDHREPGALVLMHPTANTVAALPRMIEQLQSAGYQLVTVSSIISPTRPIPKTYGEAVVGARA